MPVPTKILHVVPQNDDDTHSLNLRGTIGAKIVFTCLCKCEPEHKEVNGSLIIVHNLFDGREGVEWTNEILNGK